MSGITATNDRNGAVMQIVAPGVGRGRFELTAGSVATSEAIQGEAFYIFCKSLIHVAEGVLVTAADAPVDARGGVYLSCNKGKSVSVRLMDGEEDAVVWLREVR